MKKIKKTLPKGIIKRIAEINKLIKFAADNDISAIEYTSTWESVYDFQPIVIKNQFVTILYTEPYEKNKLTKDRYNANNPAEIKQALTWVKRCIEKGIREYKKDEKRESLTGNNNMKKIEKIVLTANHYGENIVIMRFANGKYVIYFGYNRITGHSNSTAGTFKTLKEAKETLKKIRPGIFDKKAIIRKPKSLKEKQYIFIYEDRNGNELQRKQYSFISIAEARKHAKNLLANSMMNDLHKIVVKLDGIKFNKRGLKGATERTFTLNKDEFAKMKTINRTSLPNKIVYNGKIYVRGEKTGNSIKVLVLSTSLKNKVDIYGKPYKPNEYYFNPISSSKLDGIKKISPKPAAKKTANKLGKPCGFKKGMAGKLGRPENSPIRKFAYYAYNYEPDFIRKVWAHDKLLADHLVSKFNGYYKQYTDRGVMIAFYVNLDQENQKILENYIIKNYNC